MELEELLRLAYMLLVEKRLSIEDGSVFAAILKSQAYEIIETGKAGEISTEGLRRAADYMKWAQGELVEFLRGQELIDKEWLDKQSSQFQFPQLQVILNSGVSAGRLQSRTLSLAEAMSGQTYPVAQGRHKPLEGKKKVMAHFSGDQARGISERIQTAREEAGITLERFALRCDRPAAWVVAIELGGTIRLHDGVRAAARLSEMQDKYSLTEILLGEEAGVSFNSMHRAAPGSGYVEAVNLTARELQELDLRFGADEVASLGLALFEQAREKLTVPAWSAGVEGELERATSRLGGVVGWLLFDATKNSTAQAVFDQAADLAMQCGDLDNMGVIAVSRGYQGLWTSNPDETLRVTNQALAGSQFTDRSRSLFALQQARALAALGNEAEARRRLKESEHLFSTGESSQEPFWSWWMSDLELSASGSRVHFDLGDWSKSLDYADRALEACPPGRERMRLLCLSGQLRSLNQIGAYGEVENLVREMIPLVERVGSARALTEVNRTVNGIDNSRLSFGLRESLKQLQEAMGHEGYTAQVLREQVQL